MASTNDPPALQFRVGDLVRVDLLGDDKWRPGVVLRVEDVGPLIGVICGTRTRRDHYEHLEVDPRTRRGKALGLDATTYFYANVHLVTSSRLQPLNKRCPPDLLIELQELVHQALLKR